MKAFKEFFSFIIEKRATQEEMLGGFILEPQPHIALTVSQELCQNLCSFKWLKIQTQSCWQFYTYWVMYRKNRRTFYFYESQ